MLLSECWFAGGELPLGCQAVHRRRTSKTPRRNNGVTDGASQGGRWDERYNGMPLQVVHDVPAGMEEPAEADAAVRVESRVGAIGDDSSESKLPDAQPPIEIGGASASDHDGVEVPALWLLERRGRDNEERGYDDRRQYISQVNLHCCVIPFYNDRMQCRTTPRCRTPRFTCRRKPERGTSGGWRRSGASAVRLGRGVACP